MSGYNYPIETGVGLTGAIPLIAIPLKLLSSWLPENFQYFGWWYLSSYLLQAYWGMRLLKTLEVKSPIALVIGATFFVISPVLLARTGHVNLCTQWLILWSLDVYFRQASLKSKAYTNWWIILLTAFIHQYLLLMMLGIAFATSLKHYKEGLKNRWKQLGRFILFNGIHLVTVLKVWYTVGNFKGNVGLMADTGFGFFSSNLNSLFNNMGIGKLVPALKYRDGQMEGLAYLGFGILSLGLITACFYLTKNQNKSVTKTPNFPKISAPSNRSIWIIATIFALFSFSHIGALGDKILYQLDFLLQNKTIAFICMSFRSSGRFIWVLHYLILGKILALFWQIDRKETIKIAILATILSIQLYDIYPFISRDKQYLERKSPVFEESIPQWVEITKSAKRIVMYPPYDWSYKTYLDYAFFAKIANINRQSITTGYLARTDRSVIDNYAKKLNENLDKGILGDEENSIFIVKKDNLIHFQPLRDSNKVLAFLYHNYGIVVPISQIETIKRMEQLCGAPLDDKTIGLFQKK
jgi:Family of unknown function (DUF6311)